MEKEYVSLLKCREFLSKASHRPDDWENSELLSGTWVRYSDGDRQVGQKSEILFKFLKIKT